MKIREIATPNPQCIAPEASIIQAAQTMKSLNVGMLPVCDRDRLCGTVTDRDIAIRAVAAGLNLNATTVAQIMSPGVYYCFDSQSLSEVADMMEEHQVRRLPVLNMEKRLVGIVSLGDLAVRTGKEKLAGEVLERVSQPAAAAA